VETSWSRCPRFSARPQIIKSVPFIHLASRDQQIHLGIIHTGQHYDYEMTKTLASKEHIGKRKNGKSPKTIKIH